jgi:hypothetical protein
METKGLAVFIAETLLILSVPGVVCGAQSEARPEPSDWFAGDVHMHRSIHCGLNELLTPPQLLEMMKPNNLAVICVLADIGNGEGKPQEVDIPFITGKDNPVSTPNRIVHWGGEWHFDPEGVTSGRQAIGGHLVVLGIQHGKSFFSEYTYPVFAWAKEQGGIAGFAHMQYLPIAFYPPPDGIPQSLDCCAPLELPVETALGSASFVVEDVHGGDSALEAYYRLLNTGFRPGLAAGTDYHCNGGDPLGSLLTYVRIPGGQLSYEKWIDGIARGRTEVSRNGHSEFLDLEVNGNLQPGDETRLEAEGPVRVRVEWRSLKHAIGRIEVVQNGAVVASETADAAPGKPAVFETTLDVRQSGWLAARRMDWQRGHQTHTGPVFVMVKDAPVRASAADARFFVSWIDNLLKQTSPGGEWSKYFTNERDAAQKRYREAREIFIQRAAEAERQSAEGRQ